MEINTTELVDSIGELHLEGNVIPHSWYQSEYFQKTTEKSGSKPYLLAMLIMADILYWYRPTYVQDETTGKIVVIKKKFKSDKLQRSYEQIAEKFGIDKQSAQRACYFLRDKNLIEIEYRTLNINGQKIANVVFLNPVIETVKQSLMIPVIKIDETPHQNRGDGVIKIDDTNTKITYTDYNIEKNNNISACASEESTPDEFHERLRFFPFLERQKLPAARLNELADLFAYIAQKQKRSTLIKEQEWLDLCFSLDKEGMSVEGIKCLYRYCEQICKIQTITPKVMNWKLTEYKEFVEKQQRKQNQPKPVHTVFDPNNIVLTASRIPEGYL